MPGITRWNKTTTPAGSDGWNLTPDIGKALDTANVIVPVATDAERDGLTPPGGKYPGLAVSRTDLPGCPLQIWTGARWSWHRQIGKGKLSAATLVAQTPGWTDLITVTATSLGGEVTVDFNAHLTNPNSGANQDAAVKVLCDGVEIDSFSFTIPLVSGVVNPAFPSQKFFHTPAAGSHTWKLQANATALNSVNAARASMTVTEQT